MTAHYPTLTGAIATYPPAVSPAKHPLPARNLADFASSVTVFTLAADDLGSLIDRARTDLPGLAEQEAVFVPGAPDQRNNRREREVVAEQDGLEEQARQQDRAHGGEQGVDRSETPHADRDRDGDCTPGGAQEIGVGQLTVVVEERHPELILSERQ